MVEEGLTAEERIRQRAQRAKEQIAKGKHETVNAQAVENLEDAVRVRTETAEMERALTIIEGEKVKTHPRDQKVGGPGSFDDEYNAGSQSTPPSEPLSRVQRAQKFMRENPLGNYLAYGIEIIPFVGDGLNIVEGALGKDYLTDTPIVGWDRLWYIGAGFVPGVPGRFVRDVKNVVVEGIKQLIYGDDYQKLEGGKKLADALKATLDRTPYVVNGAKKVGNVVKNVRSPRP